MAVEPFHCFGESKIAAPERAHDEFENTHGIGVQIKTVEQKKRVRSGKSDALVAVDERVINRKRFHKRSRFFGHAAVIASQRPKYRRFQQAAVANSKDSAVLLDLPFVNAKTSAMVR